MPSIELRSKFFRVSPFPMMKAVSEALKKTVVTTVADEMRRGGMLNRYRTA